MENKPTQEYIDALAEHIEKMDQFEMCRVWRFAKSGDHRLNDYLITSSGKGLGIIFSDRLFKHFNGFTPEISKQLGWEQ